MDIRSQKILKNQKIVFFSMVAIVLTGALFLYFSFLAEEPTNRSVQQVKVELPGDKINPYDIWQSKIEGENKVLAKQLEYIEKTMLDIKKAEVDKDKENVELRKEVNSLREELKKQKTVTVNQRPIISSGGSDVAEGAKTSSRGVSSYFFDHHEDPFVSGGLQNGAKTLTGSGVNSRAFNEISKKSGNRALYNVKNAIPAGTTVKAILVSSVDATCSINSKSDPHPVKLRILDDGHLPKEVMARLKGGLVIASAYGDISTERVYIRLERLTKVEASGDFVETSIAGFVSGEDGKFGVRGTVVDKSEKIVANAAKSGFLGGIGDILQSAVSKHEVNQYSFDVVKQGCAGGASSAFDTLADYYIRRAEQVMPVIQVSAGREVDITFTHLAEIGDFHTQEKVKEVRNVSRNNKHFSQKGNSRSNAKNNVIGSKQKNVQDTIEASFQQMTQKT